MSRDRLREARSQQQGGQQLGGQQYGYGQPAPGSYAPQQSAPAAASGFSQPSYGQYPPQQAQQPPYPPQQSNQASYGNGAAAEGYRQGDMQSFFAEVEEIQDDIKQMHQYVNQISDLHSRRLATTDDAQQSESSAHLQELTQATSSLTNSIRDRITRLNNLNKQSPPGDAEFNTRKLQVGGLQNAFRRGLEEYNLVEKKSREKYRQRVERQIRIVKPDATQAEIKAAFDDQQAGQQIFSQAVSYTMRTSQGNVVTDPVAASPQLVSSRQSGARAAFAEVQSRNQDLRKIEETITQLAQMMQDMATLVLEQDDSVKQIEATAVQANADVEQGLQQTQKAVKSARAARKKRIFCAGIVVAIIVVVVVVVVVEVKKK